NANVWRHTAETDKHARPEYSVRIVIFPPCAAFAWLQYILQPCWYNNFFSVSFSKSQSCDLQLKDTENQRRPLGGNRMTFAYHPATHPGRKHEHDYTQ